MVLVNRTNRTRVDKVFCPGFAMVGQVGQWPGRHGHTPIGVSGVRVSDAPRLRGDGLLTPACTVVDHRIWRVLPKGCRVRGTLTPIHHAFHNFSNRECRQWAN